MPMTARELFARLIKCEAGGEGDNGMRAVASVVMNRVNVPYGQYFRTCQGDLRKVITEPGEFTCLLSTIGGVVNPQTVWSSPPEQIHYDVADWAIGGGHLGAVSNSLWYQNPFSPTCPGIFPYNGTGSLFNRINQHCFYIPTSKYAQT